MCGVRLVLDLTPQQLRALYDAIAGRVEDAYVHETEDVVLEPIMESLDAMYAKLAERVD